MSFEKMNNGYIVDGLMSVYNSKLKEVLKDLSLTYSIKDNGKKNITLDELYEKYCLNDLVLEEVTAPKKKRRKKNKQLEKTELCMAKKADGCQCTRRRKDGNEYCGKHMGNLKFGRIDDEEKYANNDQYIKTMHEKIGGNDYLVDSNNIVYTFDKTNPTIIGIKKGDKIIPAEEALNRET